MGKLIYTALTSCDGYIADQDGNFDWAEPQEDVHTAVNELDMNNGVMLLGRKMYEILAAWEDIPDLEHQPDYIKGYAAAWKKARKIVYSRSIDAVHTSNTIFKRDFLKSEIEAIKREERKNLGIGGADLASEALAMGLIDEIFLFMFPVLTGSGKKWIEGEAAVHLKRLESRDFKNGVVMLHYEVVKEV